MRKDELKETYNLIAKKYGGYRRRLWPEAVRFLKTIKSTTILDLGSGNAYYAKEAEALGHKLIISDFAIEQIRAARKMGITNPAVVFDAVRMPIKSRSFSAVTSFALLHHIPTKRGRTEFLKEIKRILKPNGRAFLTAIKHKTGGFDASIPFGEFGRYYHFFSLPELKELITAVKFSDWEINSSDEVVEKEIKIGGKARKVKIGNYFIALRK